MIKQTVLTKIILFSFLGVLLFPLNVNAQEKQKDGKPYIVLYAKNNISLEGGKKIKQYQKLLAVPDISDKEFIRIAHPYKCKIERSKLLNEKQMDIAYFNHSNKAYEMRVSKSENKNTAVKFIKANKLNIREEASIESETVGSFSKHEKVLVEINKKDQVWTKVLSPKEGYVHNKYFLSKEEVESECQIHTNTAEQINKALKGNTYTDAKSAKKLKADTKEKNKIDLVTADNKKEELFAQKNTKKLSTRKVEISWTEKTDYNSNKYNSKADLNIKITDKTKKSDYSALILYRESKQKNFDKYSIIKEFSLEKPGKITIGRKKELDKGFYNFIIEIYDTKTGELICITGNRNNKLNRKRFETSAQDRGEDGKGGNRNQLSLLPGFSPYFMSVEKGFNPDFGNGLFKNKYPWGGNLEYSRTNWPISFGFGYNSMQVLSDSEAFKLKTNTFNLYLKYTPFTLFNDHFEPFISVGATMWYGRFENILYPEMTDYYPVHKDNGLGYSAGIGAVFNFGNFIIGAQYKLYGSRESVLGELASDPQTALEAEEWQPSNQYKLYTGSNQLQIIIGYRFEF